MTECAHDGRPADGAVLCGDCWNDLEARLAGVPDLLAELTVTITKQARTAAARVGGRNSDEPPLIFDERASEARTVLRDVLSAWCRDVAASAGDRITALPGADQTRVAARWLAAHPGAVRHHTEAGQLYDEVTDAIRQAYRAVDLQPDRVYAGLCECGLPLYARLGARYALCRGCESEHDVIERRAGMLAALEHREYPAFEAARILAALGVQVRRNTITKWADRGRLPRRSDRPTYRLGDIVEVAAGRNAA